MTECSISWSTEKNDQSVHVLSRGASGSASNNFHVPTILLVSVHLSVFPEFFQLSSVCRDIFLTGCEPDVKGGRKR